jgi:fructose/tagatose bisphosphate aldolase
MAPVRNESIDNLARENALKQDLVFNRESNRKIREIAAQNGIFSASTSRLYERVAKEEIGGFTVPAINVRFATYNTARAIIRAAMKNRVGIFIFEIARSEMQYTCQDPAEYVTSVMAAAIREGYKGPIFLQGDHYQFKMKNYKQDPLAEIESIKRLAAESVEAGFRNIDIDASTLVDLSRMSVKEQQRDNSHCTAELVKFIRSLENGKSVSIGGEIGEVGGRNSTVEEFEAYISGLNEEIEGLPSISKVSVQTGTSHGGIPMPDGSVKLVDVDFSVHESIARSARRHGLGGTVQHGASTLPEEFFPNFPKTGTIEIHLATEFQNIMFNLMPGELKAEVYAWLERELKDEFKESQTLEQNIYKTRKKAAGPFKRSFWDLPHDHQVFHGIEEKIVKLFKLLNVIGTKDMVDETYIARG